MASAKAPNQCCGRKQFSTYEMNFYSKRPRDGGENCDSGMDVSNSSIPSNDHNDFHALVAGIQSSFTTKQRLFALHKLRKIIQTKEPPQNHSFSLTSILSNHDDNHVGYASSLHIGNFEDFMNAGGINALILQLHHLVYSHGSILPELELLCYCLSLIFRLMRKNKAVVELLVDQDSDFMVLLSSASLLASQKRQGSKLNAVHRIPSVQHSTMTIFYIITSSSTGSALFLKCTVAVELVAHVLADREICEDSVYESLGVYKNLTYYQEDSRLKLIKSPGFVQGLTRCDKATLTSSRQRQLAVIRNLATTVECRSLLVAQPPIVGALIDSLLWEPHSNLESEATELHTLRRNVFIALVSLSMDHNSALLLIFYGDGILLSILQRFLRDSIDSFLRKKSACVLRLLANEVTAPLLVHDADLMYSLSDAALRDDSLEVRREAAEAFARCAAFVQLDRQPHFECVLDALTVLVERKSPTKVVAVNSLARALKEQSLHPKNQRPMVRRGVLLEAIAQMALLRNADSTSAATDACSALLNLSSDTENVEELTNNTMVLEALLSNASSYYANGRERKKYALSSLVNMTQNTNCRRILVRHGCILQTLIQEAKVLPLEQREFKIKLKHAVLLLALEL
jgi:hypothetical protein